MCGNAIRCVGKFLYERGYTAKTELAIETLSGDRRLTLDVKEGKVVTVSVGMGRAILSPADVPVRFDGEKMINEPLTVGGKEYRITAVSMGNPHAVTFVPDVGSVEIDKIGPQFEYLPIFPDRVNTEFVRVLSRDRTEMRVWERGSGETLACGTGATASAYATMISGRCSREVTMHLLGGDLQIRLADDGHLFMTGPAVEVFSGEIDL
jgi:diaminopimelate epimerase